MQNLTSLFAAALSEKEAIPKKESALKRGDSHSTILQLNSIPLKIDLDKYKNAHSADNPTGDYKAAYLFTVLANTIPELDRYFNNSSYLVTDIWENILDYADSNVLYTNHLLNRAKEKFTSSAMSGMGGIPEHWYPVYANPSNWYDIVQDESALIKMELDLQNAKTDTGSFIVIDEGTPLTWKAKNRKKETISLNIHPDTVIKKIQLTVLRVDFIRPWFDFEILNQQNWEITGLDKCYYSNGKLTLNHGIFPLLTQSILLGTKISIEGNFSKNDIRAMTEHKRKGSEVSLGPFLLNANSQKVNIDQKEGGTILTSNIKQVVGYISRLTPISPGLPT